MKHWTCCLRICQSMTMRHIHHYCSVTSLTINFYQVIFFSTYLSSVECVSFRVSILRHLKLIKFVSTIMWKAKFEINFFRHSQIAASNEPSTWAKKNKNNNNRLRGFKCGPSSLVHAFVSVFFFNPRRFLFAFRPIVYRALFHCKKAGHHAAKNHERCPLR